MRKTMKKYLMFLASAALVFAASCNKIEETDTTVASGVETELITVELNPMTKTALGTGGATTWSEGDAVSVTVGGIHIGDLTLVEGSTFSGEVEAGKSGEALLHYPSGVAAVPTTQAAVANSFANGAALLDGTTTMDALREGTSVELKNSTALLQFTVAQAGDVTFEVGDTDYTITGCETGKTYYACVAPAEGVGFVARIGGYFSKQAPADVTFTASKIAPLGELPAPVKSSWGLIGLNGDWNNDFAMYNDLDGYSVAKNVNIKSTDEFKFRVGQWTKEVSGGLTAPDTKRANNTTVKANITISQEGIYDVYTNGTNYYIMTPGKSPSSASEPSAINITITSVDAAYKCLHMWGAVNISCKYNENSTWTVDVPADKLDERVQVILTKGANDGSWTGQTSDSDHLCLRNPMKLKVDNGKAVHN